MNEASHNNIPTAIECTTLALKLNPFQSLSRAEPRGMAFTSPGGESRDRWLRENSRLRSVGKGTISIVPVKPLNIDPRISA
jgi:hypothetical protein